MSKKLQTLNQQNKLALWAERISACRDSGQGVKKPDAGSELRRCTGKVTDLSFCTRDWSLDASNGHGLK